MAKPGEMSPGFSSRRQAFGFLGVLVAALLLPWGMARIGIEPPRSQVYLTIPLERGPFSYVHQQIFEETGDIDVLFLGDSLMWDAFDPRLLAAEIEKKEGRAPVVRLLGFNWRQEDMVYFLLKDVLAHRKVKLLVLNMPTEAHVLPGIHYGAYRWLRQSEIADAHEGLPWSAWPQFYAAAMLGAPRQLLSVLRANRLEESIPYAGTDGHHEEKSGYRGRPYVDRNLRPLHPAFAHAPATSHHFDFAGKPLNPYQLHFLKKTFGLIKTHSVSTAVVHVPRSSERNETVVRERMPWSDVLGGDFAMVGIPPLQLFDGLSEEDVLSLYYDEHLNAAGGRFVTQAFRGVLAELYDRAKRRDSFQAANATY